MPILNCRNSRNAPSTGAVIIGFDDQTHANLITIPPPLQIVPADTGVSLIWPVLASNCVLQTTPILPANWNNVTNPPTAIGTTNLLTLPVTGASAFFRLAPR